MQKPEPELKLEPRQQRIKLKKFFKLTVRLKSSVSVFRFSAETWKQMMKASDRTWRGNMFQKLEGSFLRSTNVVLATN